jgi:predicted nuclease of predicted toxin-antitoxin system
MKLRQTIMAWVRLENSLKKKLLSDKEVQEIERYVARKAKPRFYADENFPKEAVDILRGLGARVVTAQEAKKQGEPDENHASYALKKGLVLVTCDRDFLDNRKFPLIHCPAIFVFDFGHGTTWEIWQAFRCLGSVFCAPQIFDKWCKVDAKRETWTETARFLNGTSARWKCRLHRGALEEWV